MQDIFLAFHLDKKETEAFLELVRLGASPVSVWAKHAGIKRSSMYVLLRRLEEAGLVSTFTHKNVQLAQAIPVSQLPSLLAKKQQAIESTKAVLETKLPELLALEDTHAIVPKVRFFEGKRRVEAMYEEVMKEKSFKAFFHPKRVKTSMPEYFDKIPQALKANGGKARELLIRCKEADQYISEYRSKNHQIALLPRSITFSSDTIITKQKIYLVGYSSSDVVATEIWNEELAQTQSVLFDLIWSSVL